MVVLEGLAKLLHLSHLPILGLQNPLICCLIVQIEGTRSEAGLKPRWESRKMRGMKHIAANRLKRCLIRAEEEKTSSAVMLIAWKSGFSKCIVRTQGLASLMTISHLPRPLRMCRTSGRNRLWAGPLSLNESYELASRHMRSEEGLPAH